jgi:hypothetical protein
MKSSNVTVSTRDYSSNLHLSISVANQSCVKKPLPESVLNASLLHIMAIVTN